MIFHDSPLILAPNLNPKAVVIWLHGLGADGHDFVPLVEEMNTLNAKLSEVKFIFPHAPLRRITLNHGRVMRGWYDIDNLSLLREDEQGVRESVRYIQEILESEHQKGVPYEKMILAGFSQGGAIALFAGLTLPFSIGGILALSTYVPIAPIFQQESTRESAQTPLLMVHGSSDSIIDLSVAERSRDLLNQLGYSLKFMVYPMDHTVCRAEVIEINQFLDKIING